MPKIIDHSAHREELLGKAFVLFADKGYSALSMRQLAQGLGVSTGSLYHYFPSKDAIFEQMVTWLTERDILQATADITPEASPEERLELVFAWVRFNEAYLQKMLLLVFDFQRHRNEPEAHALIAAAASRYRETFCELAGCGNVGWSALLGMLIQGLLEGAENNPEEHLEALGAMAQWSAA
ncbi:MAG: helix-turn-helix domain-containing protein [Myxococcota bacterium]|nr:helix-turn-helix domain-containing protein [Myxococcota bacterium]